MKKINYVCTECGSDAVLNDAYAEWNVERQEFELSSTYNAWICEDCDGETNVKEQATISLDETLYNGLCLVSEMMHEAMLEHGETLGNAEEREFVKSVVGKARKITFN